jgi:hypothetical protein
MVLSEATLRYRLQYSTPLGPGLLFNFDPQVKYVVSGGLRLPLAWGNEDFISLIGASVPTTYFVGNICPTN